MMDPITTALTAALFAGAASGLTEVAKKAIADGYNGLKALLHKKHGDKGDVAQALEKLEAKPESEGRKTTLGEEMKASSAAEDPELLSKAEALLKLLEGMPQAQKHVQIAKGIGIAQAQGGGTASVTISGSVQGSSTRKD